MKIRINGTSVKVFDDCENPINLKSVIGLDIKVRGCEQAEVTFIMRAEDIEIEGAKLGDIIIKDEKEE